VLSVAARIQPSPDAVAAQVGDEIVLVHMKTDCIYVLNRTGARLWELLSARCDRAEVRRRMLAEFDVSEAELEQELDRWLDRLAADSLITVEE
jgi:hypothetical protein